MEYGSGILLNLGNPFINQSTIRYHSSTGIKMDSPDSQSQSGVSIKITNNTISNNTHSSDGGGICLQGNGAVIISGNTISDNIAGEGAGIASSAYSATISDNTIENNKAGRYGGPDNEFRLEGSGGGIYMGSAKLLGTI